MPSPLEGNALFRGIYCWLAANQDNAQYCTPDGELILRDGLLPMGWEWLAFTVAALAIAALVVNIFLVECDAGKTSITHPGSKFPFPILF